MPPTLRVRGIYVVAVVLGASPLVFGLIRAVGSRHDIRMVWMAVAALLGANLAIVIGKPRTGKPVVVLARSVAALAMSTLLAAWTRFTKAPWPLLVSLQFRLCLAFFLPQAMDSRSGRR